MEIDFSCHAVLRYLERFRGIPIRKMRNEGESDADLLTRLSKEYKLRKYEMEGEIMPMTPQNIVSLKLAEGADRVHITTALGQSATVVIEWNPAGHKRPVVLSVLSQRKIDANKTRIPKRSA